MTAAMIYFFHRLPRTQKYPLPPREITMNLANEVGVKEDLSEPEKKAATLIGHFSYGAAMGTLYATLAPQLRLDNVRGGILFGLAVWGGSYLGWLPALGLHRPAVKESAQRNALMIAAHVVWGMSLTSSLRAFQSLKKV